MKSNKTIRIDDKLWVRWKTSCMFLDMTVSKRIEDLIKRELYNEE